MTWLINIHRSILISLIKQYDLLRHLVAKDIASRYRGSYIGFLWTFINPLLLLAVYTFVFSVVLHSKWNPNVQEGRLDFAITLFAGLLFFNIYADATNRSSSIIHDHKNYVKKVIFPLHFLPIITVVSGFFTGLMSLLMLSLVLILFKSGLSWSILWIPIISLPLLLMTTGAAMIISALGVYIKDIVQIVGLLNMLFMFLSPIFFPIEKIPSSLHALAAYNPIADVVTQARTIIISHGSFHPMPWLHALLISSLILEAGIVFFFAVQRGFADVL